MVRGSGVRRWAMGAALLAVAGTAAAGCGGGSSKGGSGDAAKAANGAANGAAAGEAPKDGPAAALIALAASSSAPKTVGFTGDVVDSGDAQKLKGGLDFGATLRGDVTMADPAQGGKQMRVIVDGSKHYMSADMFRSSSPSMAKAVGDKKWVKTDAGTALAAHENTPAAAFGGVVLESDPDLVKAFAAVFAAGVLKPTGEAGHYAGTVEAATLAVTKFDASHKAAVTAAMKDLSVTSEKLEIWLGADGLPTKLTFSDAVGAGKKPSSGEVHFSDWGKPVPVTVPPEGDTMGFDALQDAIRKG